MFFFTNIYPQTLLWHFKNLSIYIYIIYICVCVCMCVCVWETNVWRVQIGRYPGNYFPCVCSSDCDISMRSYDTVCHRCAWFCLFGLYDLVENEMCKWNGRYGNDSSLSLTVSPLGNTPDSKVHEANMGPILGRQDPGGPHVGTMNFAIWDCKYNVVFVNGSRK